MPLAWPEGNASTRYENGLPAGFERWGSERGELGGDGKDAVKFSVRVRGGHAGGHTGKHSGSNAKLISMCIFVISRME